MIRPRIPLVHRPWLWDGAIGALVIVGSLLAGLSLHRVFSGESWWWLGAGLLGMIGALTVLYGSFVAVRRIILNKKIIHISALPSLRIAVLGDFHVGPYKSADFVARAVARAMETAPDLLLLPGDFLFDFRSDLAALEPLRHLHAPLGVFAVTGNHDSGTHLHHGRRLHVGDRTADLTALLTTMGIRVLRNAHALLTHAGRPLAIAGIDDLWSRTCDLDAAMQGIPADAPVILLSHNPDAALDERSRRAVLIVSGHTHGGQIRLPFIGALHPIPDALGRRYDRGVFSVHDGATTLAITHGLGETQARARLFCPPEIMVLEIRPSS